MLTAIKFLAAPVRNENPKESKVLRGRGKCFSSPFMSHGLSRSYKRGAKRWQTSTPWEANRRQSRHSKYRVILFAKDTTLSFQWL